MHSFLGVSLNASAPVESTILSLSTFAGGIFDGSEPVAIMIGSLIPLVHSHSMKHPENCASSVPGSLVWNWAVSGIAWDPKWSSLKP